MVHIFLINSWTHWKLSPGLKRPHYSFRNNALAAQVLFQLWKGTLFEVYFRKGSTCGTYKNFIHSGTFMWDLVNYNGALWSWYATEVCAFVKLLFLIYYSRKTWPELYEGICNRFLIPKFGIITKFRAFIVVVFAVNAFAWGQLRNASGCVFIIQTNIQARPRGRACMPR